MSKLNAKLKILIIIGYSLLLFVIIFLVFNKKHVDAFGTYGYTPYDENIGVMIKVSENRKSVLDNYNKNDEVDKEKGQGKHESATYDVDVNLIKLKRSLVENIKVKVAIKTKDNGYQYAEYKSSSSDNAGVFVKSTGDFNNLLSKEVKEENIGTSKKAVFDESPKEIYVEIKYNYRASEKDKKTEHTLKYRVETLEVKNRSFNKYEERTVIKEKTSSCRENYIDSKNDIINLQIGVNQTTKTSVAGEVFKDTIKLNLVSVTENLNKYKLENATDPSVYKRIEFPSRQEFTPEISELKITVYGKVDNKDKYYSEYVLLYSLYGFVSSEPNRLILQNSSVSVNRNTHLVENSLDEQFNLNKIYVTMAAKLHNSTAKEISSKYFVQVANLVTADEVK